MWIRCYREETECSCLAAQPKEEHLFPNKSSDKKRYSAAQSYVWKCGNLTPCAWILFCFGFFGFFTPTWIHPFPQVISSPPALPLKVNPRTQEFRQRPKSHVSPAAFIPETLQSVLTPGSQGWGGGPASPHWWNHEPCQVMSALCSAPITWM